MKVSLNWIRDYVKLPEDMDLKRLAYDLTMSTVEVEDAVDLGASFHDMVVGEIKEVLPHPNADKLRICRTDIGGGDIKEIVCGGTTSNVVSRYLGQPIIASLDYHDPDVPPISRIKGVDLTTEGVITLSKVLTYAEDFLDQAKLASVWATQKDGASLIARELFENATDVNFFVGRAINPAHQNPNLPITFGIKQQLITSLADCLRKMGKHVRLSYF